MGKDRDIDDIRDRAREDAQEQTERRRGDPLEHIGSVIDPTYNPPSDPDDRAEYDRIYRDERNK